MRAMSASWIYDFRYGRLASVTSGSVVVKFVGIANSEVAFDAPSLEQHRETKVIEGMI
jgi:hypothetical protein